MPPGGDQQPSNTRHRHGNRRVVQHGRASTTTSIAQANVLKNDELFFLCNPDGQVPFDESHGLGLYYHDCRYLDGYEVRLGATPADRLSSNVAKGFSGTFELTNPDLDGTGGRLVEKERVGIRWDRTLDADAAALRDHFALTNFGVDAVELPFTIRLRSHFDSLFEVRGAQPERRGTIEKPRWEGETLRLTYDGADKVRRSLAASFQPAPQDTDGTEARFRVTIQPQQTVTIALSLSISESGNGAQGEPTDGKQRVSAERASESSEKWVAAASAVRSDEAGLDRVLDRSLRDLHLLKTGLRGRVYFAAGVPWYVTLFGRDSIITAIEALAFLPGMAEDTVRLLASFQGTRDDDWRDEAPGKIMHELRVGEMARLNEIPQTPYYGSVDATPLFLVLLSAHARWTGRLDLFNEVKPHVEAALGWIDREMQGGRFLSYSTGSSKGLSNQGWKDSGDSIVNEDGSLAEPPIALVEVQGYVYMAKRGIADLYRRAGDEQSAQRLAKEADDLRERFERHFWSEKLGTYALALQKGDRPALVASSNPGQALWTGIVAPDRAARTAERLMRDDMFSGWGIRTLSSRERRYNPIGYHDGTVWPHDNAIAAAGFRRYGCLDPLERTLTNIVQAAGHFAHARLPEVFAGFDRKSHAVPVNYPVACHPQAWAAGAVPFMLQSALGLRADAFNGRLHIERPVLPAGVHRLSIGRLRVGDAHVHAVFVRQADGCVKVEDVKVEGRLEVLVK